MRGEWGVSEIYQIHQEGRAGYKGVASAVEDDAQNKLAGFFVDEGHCDREM